MKAGSVASESEGQQKPKEPTESESSVKDHRSADADAATLLDIQHVKTSKDRHSDRDRQRHYSPQNTKPIIQHIHPTSISRLESKRRTGVQTKHTFQYPQTDPFHRRAAPHRRPLSPSRRHPKPITAASETDHPNNPPKKIPEIPHRRRCTTAVSEQKSPVLRPDAE